MPSKTQAVRLVLNREQALKDRKSTRLNSSHLVISYAVFCLKKKKNTNIRECHRDSRLFCEFTYSPLLLRLSAPKLVTALRTPAAGATSNTSTPTWETAPSTL